MFAAVVLVVRIVVALIVVLVYCHRLASAKKNYVLFLLSFLEQFETVG